MNPTIKKRLEQLPEAPGIYKMLDASGRIIYIGKSKCLKKRVHSYFVPNPKWDKARRMSGSICDIQTIVTDTHLEAMLLECELIKKIRPCFNTLMKNDGRYSYLTLEENFRKKPLKLTLTRDGRSFGPFRSRGKVQTAMDLLVNLYPLSGNEHKFDLEYHVFPYVMNREEFDENRRVLNALFSDADIMAAFRMAVSGQMLNAAAETHFERAKRYKDLNDAMAYIQNALLRYKSWTHNGLVYGVRLPEGYKLFLIADGQIRTSVKVADFSDAVRKDFILDCEKKGMLKNVQSQDEGLDEKGMVDYMDIIYGELSEADPEMIFLL